ncbi:MAG: hypothetical protein KDI07_14400 [Anaerolineae bacterium]|nr:hypothetical protein [Anaerolineae bacterium]
MKTRKRYILVKMESTYGTDPTPTASDAVLTNGLQREIYSGPTVSRETDLSTLGAREQINTAPMVTRTFSTEMMGTGTLGTPPNYGALLRACGFAETISASTDVQYDPVSSSFESIAMYMDRDGERQISLGCRATGGLSFAAGQIPLFNFVVTGLYTKPAAQTLVTPAYSPNIAPYPVNKANTPTCTLGAYDLQLQSLDIDFGNNVPHVNLVNYEEVLITDRAMSGTMTILAPLISTKDMFALVESHAGITTSAFQLIHGPTPNIVQLDAPAMQLTGISEVDINGEQGYQLPFILKPSSGDDELKITFK